jgi:hypothetical protein
MRSWWARLDPAVRRQAIVMAYQPLPESLVHQLDPSGESRRIVVSEANGVTGQQWFLSREAAEYVSDRARRVHDSHHR